ncbi:MAG: zinc-dependent alcohol dehydrogenase family protein [Alphaproteobacteria bacterium]|nr:zinc-dependent alcohol dehydrogenase family protein [Alphaproteobacteria bacterium]
MIKKIQFDQFGPASEVLQCVDAPSPPSPGAGEVEIEMIYMPLNPSDLMMTGGIYGGPPPALPCDMGREGVGRIAGLGPEVSGFSVGDLVMPFTAPTWQSRIVRPVDALIALPSGIELQQAAMLRSGPATAALMLRDYVTLQEGDWVIQNVANSAVGTCFAQLAGNRGIRTLNIVRRMGSGAHLNDIPGAVVIEHLGGPSDELKQKVAEATAGEPVKLGLDAIAGPSTDALAQCLANGATLVNYGVLSKEPCQIYGGHLHFRNITMRGFWMSQWLQLSAPEEIQALYGELAELMDAGVLKMAIAGVYSFDQIKDAAAHSAGESRDGKILIGPQPDD